MVVILLSVHCTATHLTVKPQLINRLFLTGRGYLTIPWGWASTWNHSSGVPQICAVEEGSFQQSVKLKMEITENTQNLVFMRYWQSSTPNENYATQP